MWIESQLALRLATGSAALELRCVDRVLDPHAASGWNAGSPASVVEIIGDADHAVIAPQTKAIDCIVQWCSPGELHPAMNGRYQLHGPVTVHPQSDQIAFVVVTMPDGD